MNILVLGAGGMAGHIVATYLEEVGHKVTTISANKKLNDQTVLLDATKTNELEDFLRQHEFDAVVNCIGILVKQSEDRKDLASCLNSYLPHFLEHFYADTKTKLVHLSTDCVFSGHNGPYNEDSPYDGLEFYDRSKALGEVINDKDLTFRMSIIGPEIQKKGTGLFNWFYAQSGQINGYEKAIWSGVTTLELAKGIDAALKQKLTGLYHFVPSESISKYDLLKLFSSTFGRKDITVNPVSNVSLDKTLVNTRTDFDYKVPSYKTMVAEMKDWVKEHQELYPHYS